jgi:flagellar basal body-associated protein FliL
MRKENNGISLALFWSLVILGLILGSIATFLYMRDQEEARKPLYLEVGRVSAYLGGNRLVQVDINLTVRDRRARELLRERSAQIKPTILHSFTQVPEEQIHGREGKVRLQESIRDGLNRMAGERVVTEVLFANFVMSLM